MDTLDLLVATSNLKNLLSTPCADLCSLEKRIVSVNANDNVLDALKMLLERGILSAPCVSSRSSDANGYCGFLEVRDLVEYMRFKEDHQHSKTLSNKTSGQNKPKRGSAVRAPSFNLKTHFPLDLVRMELDFNPVRDSAISTPNPNLTCKYLARRHPFVTIRPEESVLEVFKLLCQAQYRRVPVLRPGGEGFLDVISQSTLIAWLAKDLNRKQGSAFHFLLKPIYATNIGTQNVLTADVSLTAFKTFKLLGDKHLHGLAVVDKCRLVGTTDVSDLKLYIEQPELLYSSIGEFLQACKKLDGGGWVKSDASIAHVVLSMTASKKHRIFVVDEAHRPVRVITMTDIIQFVVEHSKHAAGS